MTFDFDTLDKNTHLTLYVLMKLPPDKRYTKIITRKTHLSYNTVLDKLKNLLEMELVKRRSDGLKLQYFLFPGVKKNWKEWSDTENGRDLVAEFERKLKSKDEQPKSREDISKENDLAKRTGKGVQL
ncbi:MAG: hypothetical protein ACXADA_11610 [Candidatus Hodarchaeales archaeon]|jgi:DNA-binding HxlR family transcriptional regulator